MRPLFAACLAIWLALPAAVHGQVGPDTVSIGRSAGMTGALAARMKPATEAMETYFASVNAAGGVNGRKIRLITLDDGNDAKRAADNTRKLIDEDKVFVMFANSGTAQTMAALPVITERKVPLIGTTSGAESVQQFNPLVFHYKASYGRELARIAEHLKTIGIQRVAVVHSPDPTGNEGRALAVAALQSQGITPLLVASTRPDALDPLFAGFASNPPQAIVLTALAAPGAAFFKELLKLPVRPLVLTWSVAGVEAIHKEVGEQIRGLIVSQTFPWPYGTRVKLAADYAKLMESAKLPNGGYPGIEGYIAARILVEGLQRAGRELTREKLVAALQSMRDVDLGGDFVSFDAKDHVGRKLVELTFVDAGGRFVR